MRVGIICNGLMEDFPFHRDILDKCDLVICADGGVNHCVNLKIQPSYVIGDLDSADEKILYKFLKKGTVVIKDTDQNKTDLELAIELAKEHKASELVITGAISTRFDHTLGNVMMLARLNIKARIIDSRNEIYFVTKRIELEGKKGEILSVIPLGETEGITYTGLKWGLKDCKTKFGWIGVCNEFTSNKATIAVKKGKLLVMKARD